MLRFATLFALSALLIGVEPAAAINENAGTTGFNFLKIGVGARANGLGGAFTGVSGDLEAPAWNPAGLLGVKRSATVSVTRYLIDTQAGYLSVALPNERRTIGMSFNYFTYGDMQRTDEDGQELGTFSASDVAATVTVAQRVWNNRLTLGLNFKAVYSSIDKFTSDAYMIDLGGQVPGPLEGLILGASLTNLGTVRSGYTDNFEDSLPVIFRVGFSHRPAHTPLPMFIVADFNLPNDNDPYLSFGAEISVAGGLYLRPGYSLQQTGLQGEDALGLTAGAGFVMEKYRLDYAYNSYQDLDEVHRISLSSAF